MFNVIIFIPCKALQSPYRRSIKVSATNSKATRIQVYQSIAKVNKTFMPASQKQCFIKPIAQN